MRVTTLTVQRPDGTPIAKGILAQIDQASPKQVVEHLTIGDHHTGDLWTITTLGWYPDATNAVAGLIRRGDLLIDEQFIDPTKTNSTGFGYRVVGRPKDYYLNHQEVTADSAIGD